MAKKQILGDIFATIIIVIYVLPSVKEGFHNVFCDFGVGFCILSFLLLYVIPMIAFAYAIHRILKKLGIIDLILERLN